MSKLIPLTKGKYAIVDDEDHELLSDFKWHYNSAVGYAVRSAFENGKHKKVYMHRSLIEAEGLQVDHINRDKLDNRKENLRAVTDQQNKFNLGKHKNSPSKYKGVHWRESKSKWVAEIRHNRKTIYIGIFSDDRDAAIAYNAKASELFGEYANLNTII